MLWFVENTNICNFADDSTICSSDKSVNGVIENLQPDLNIPLKWLKGNEIMTNPGKIQSVTQLE